MSEPREKIKGMTFTTPKGKSRTCREPLGIGTMGVEDGGTIHVSLALSNHCDLQLVQHRVAIMANLDRHEIDDLIRMLKTAQSILDADDEQERQAPKEEA